MLRDFTYVDDIVTGVVNVILNPAKKPTEKSEWNPTQAPYKIYNIGNNNPVKLMDFIQAIEEAFGKKFQMKMMDLQPGMYRAPMPMLTTWCVILIINQTPVFRLELNSLSHGIKNIIM